MLKGRSTHWDKRERILRKVFTSTGIAFYQHPHLTATCLLLSQASLPSLPLPRHSALWYNKTEENRATNPALPAHKGRLAQTLLYPYCTPSTSQLNQSFFF